MTPQSAAHSYPVDQLTTILVPAVGDRGRVRVQLPLVLSDSVPEPDLAIVPPGKYSQEHPSSAWLVVEVAGDSLRKDRLVKAKLYAEHGIPEYWIVNVIDSVVEVHTEIVRGVYTRVTPFARSESVRVLQFPDIAILVSEILP